MLYMYYCSPAELYSKCLFTCGCFSDDSDSHYTVEIDTDAFTQNKQDTQAHEREMMKIEKDHELAMAKIKMEMEKVELEKMKVEQQGSQQQRRKNRSNDSSSDSGAFSDSGTM